MVFLLFQPGLRKLFWKDQCWQSEWTEKEVTPLFSMAYEHQLTKEPDVPRNL